MRSLGALLLGLTSLVSSTIFQNGQVKPTNYPNTTIAAVAGRPGWRTYPADAPQLSYKGRWDSKHISWWSAPGLKFGFTGDKVAISFGNWTSDGVLIGYRLDGQDWLFTNATSSSTNLLITSETTGFNLTKSPSRTFELRVTNWAYGVQIDNIHLSANGTLLKIPDYGRRIEMIGDSLTAGDYNAYEGLSSYGWGLCEGFGATEFSITAYPGICLVDKNCWGNAHGQVYQWHYASDTSYRSTQVWGDNPEPWPFAKHPDPDIVLINIGTNDNNTANNVTSAEYYPAYIDFVGTIHDKYPDAQIILISLWNGFGPVGSSYAQGGAWIEEIYNVYQHYASEGYVHYFNTTGILQHNDIAPQYHPTDMGQVKLASHLMQYIKIKFGWDLLATGPEVQHDTLYWNDQQYY